ncbi:MAG: hypothetical protein NT154_25555 [Verrucomicrobia bacterium]|nr:hypothetical protein [Verrucomicrobiota bacterium]
MRKRLVSKVAVMVATLGAMALLQGCDEENGLVYRFAWMPVMPGVTVGTTGIAVSSGAAGAAGGAAQSAGGATSGAVAAASGGGGQVSGGAVQ